MLLVFLLAADLGRGTSCHESLHARELLELLWNSEKVMMLYSCEQTGAVICMHRHWSGALPSTWFRRFIPIVSQTHRVSSRHQAVSRL